MLLAFDHRPNELSHSLYVLQFLEKSRNLIRFSLSTVLNFLHHHFSVNSTVEDSGVDTSIDFIKGM
jgi:hypothetical protein